jgi:hypothetical protein
MLKQKSLMANIDSGGTNISEKLNASIFMVQGKVLYTEDGGSRFLQNIHNHLPDYIVSSPQKIAIYL